MTAFEIAGRTIGAGASPYIIAELGINHGGDLDTAKRMLRAVAETGADVAKLQVFRTASFLSRSSAYFDVLNDAVLPEEAIRELFALAEDIGVTLFSSVFDAPSADLMERLGAPAYKIASGDLTHLPLLAHIARFGKPMIVSTGAATMAEVKDAVDAIRGANARIPVALLHCVSNYPTRPEDVNLACMATIQRTFDVVTGFSDHTLENTTALAAVARGASIIEKHFTLDRNAEGPDHALSCDPAGLTALVAEAKTVHATIGRPEKAPVEAPDFIPMLRRSVTADVAIAAGAVITAEMLEVKRPGTGIAPRDLDRVVGRRASRDISADETLTWELVGGD